MLKEWGFVNAPKGADDLLSRLYNISIPLLIICSALLAKSPCALHEDPACGTWSFGLQGSPSLGSP